jgi:hypothetical protein
MSDSAGRLFLPSQHIACKRSYDYVSASHFRFPTDRFKRYECTRPEPAGPFASERGRPMSFDLVHGLYRRPALPTIDRSDFRLNCKDGLTEQGLWLANVVEDISKHHTNLLEGATFQIGWSVLKLVATSSGLVLCEPDFDNNPFQNYREDVSSTLEVLRGQHDLLSRVGCSPVDVRFDDKVVFFKGCLEEPGVYGERSQPTRGDSGWYIGPTRTHHTPTTDDLDAIRLYELLYKRPSLLPAMCLPAGWMVVWDGTEIVGIADPDNNERLRSNDFMLGSAADS